MIIVIPKVWFDSAFGNVERSRVRERAFQTVADLDEHFAVLNKDEQDGAVTFSLLTDAPRLRDTLRVSRDLIVALHFWKNRDENLV